MRLHLTLSPNSQVVPFNYQHQLTGAVHKWLGDNDISTGHLEKEKLNLLVVHKKRERVMASHFDNKLLEIY